MPYTPKPENKFSFGLWTVGNIGRDPFGDPVREVRSPVQLVELLGEVGLGRQLPLTTPGPDRRDCCGARPDRARLQEGAGR